MYTWFSVHKNLSILDHKYNINSELLRIYFHGDFFSCYLVSNAASEADVLCPQDLSVIFWQAGLMPQMCRNAFCSFHT